jgi:aromatic-amino-acid transaminase
MFESLAPAPPDAILGLMATFRADPRPDKVDLGVGVFRDADGRTPIPAAVKTAERRLLETQTTKTYVGLEGDAGFNAAMVGLVFADALDPARVAVVQSTGGSAAVKILADLVRRAAPGATVHVPDPTWPNHPPLLEAAGVPVGVYPYFDPATGTVAIDRMLTALRAMPRGDVVLLHGCCHNPTGADPAGAEWAAIATALRDGGLVPLVDMAYQGFGDGLDADAGGARILARTVPEMMAAVSCSKNFGIYRDRAGCAIAVAADPARAAVLRTQLSAVIRAGHTMPPDHGAAVVRTVLEDPALRAGWLEELDAMRDRIRTVRALLADALVRRTNDAAHARLAGQKGMFSRIAATPAQIEALRTRHGVYVVGDGRINIAGLAERDVERVADAIADVLRR